MARGVREVFSAGVVAALGALILLAGLGYLLSGSGPHALRTEFALRLLFLALAGWALYHGLKGGSSTPRATYPRAETALLAGGITLFVAILGFLIGLWQVPVPGLARPMPAVSVAAWILFALILVTVRPRVADLGMRRFPQITNWLLVIGVGLVGYVATVRLDFSRLDAHAAALPGLLVLLVLPAELFFRVLLQTRLELLMKPGWALLAQAVLFHVLYIPYLVHVRGFTWDAGALHLLPNLVLGVLTGIVWHRTRSLYLCVLLHAFLVYSYFPL